MSEIPWPLVVGALVTISISVGLPIYSQRQTNKNNAAVLKQTYENNAAMLQASNERADILTARTEEAARLTKKVADDLLTSNAKTSQIAAEQFRIINDKQDATHAIVNNNYTTLQQSMTVTLKSLRASRIEVIDGIKATNKDPGINRLSEIKTLDAQITALEMDIAERVKQAKSASEQK